MNREELSRAHLRNVIDQTIPTMQADIERGEMPLMDLTLESVQLLSRVFLDLERGNQWIRDIQSGLYINCVYCGHRYGPADETPETLPAAAAGKRPDMQEALRRHIEQCPKHPMSALKQDLDRGRREVESVINHLEPTGCVVRCCEGGGPEDIFGTLAITAAKLATELSAAKAGDNIAQLRPMNIAAVYGAARFMDLEVPERFPDTLTDDELDQVLELYLAWIMVPAERDRLIAEAAPEFLKRAAALYAEGFDVCDVCGACMATRKVGGEDNLDMCDACFQAAE